jgi:hypothetical protein
MPSSIRYDRLTQTHPDYDSKRIAQIEDLYEGGWRIMRKAKVYVGQLPLEHDTQYDERCKTTAYMPYFGQILDQFVADLFTQPLTIQPAGDANDPTTPGEMPDKDFYGELAKNIDGEGMSIEDLAGDVLTTSLKHRCAYIMVDAPDVADAPEPANRADEDALGVRRCYAYEVDPAQVVDWKLDRKTKRFVWVIVASKEQERENPDSSRELITERFTVWTLGADGRAQWIRYAKTYKPEEAPHPEDLIQSEAEGTTSFDRIPLMRFELPKGLWVGNKIGPQALEHWCRRSALVGAEGVSCVAIPWVSQGPELPAMGDENSEAAENPNRGRDPVGQFKRHGFMVLGHQDRLEFAEPLGHSYEIIDKQCDNVREAMFAVNHQMAASIRPTITALGRSGLSKQKDEDKTATVLGALGHLIRTFFVRLYETISVARGEDVVWVAHGLDSYEHDDREQVLEESLELQAVNIPSATFRKEHAKRMVKKLVPNLPPQTVAQIFVEIDDGIDDQQEMQKLMDDAKADAIINPPEGQVPPKNGAPPKSGAKPPQAEA